MLKLASKSLTFFVALEHGLLGDVGIFLTFFVVLEHGLLGDAGIFLCSLRMKVSSTFLFLLAGGMSTMLFNSGEILTWILGLSNDFAVTFKTFRQVLRFEGWSVLFLWTGEKTLLFPETGGLRDQISFLTLFNGMSKTIRCSLTSS